MMAMPLILIVVKLKLSQSEVGRVIRWKGRPGRRPNPKKPCTRPTAIGAIIDRG
jgi:hypothetical protein